MYDFAGPEDVPTSMREAFSDNRIAAAWQMLALANGNDRLAALGGFERLLTKRGLTLADIATALLAAPAQAAKPAASSFEQAFGGFGDIFSQMTETAKARAEGAARQAKAAVRRTYFDGTNIPEQISGRVLISDERPSRTGTMLVFTVKESFGGELKTYGPIVAFSETIIAKLRQAADKANPAHVTMKVRAPAHPNHQPSAQAVWFS